MNLKPLIVQLDNVLKPLGFIANKGIWNRRSTHLIDVVSLQGSKSEDLVTLNVGVLQKEIYNVCWAKEVPITVQDADCTVAARVRQLVDGKDEWWQLDDRETLGDIIAKTVDYALPFIKKMHSPDGMERYLFDSKVVEQKYPPPIMYLSILMIQRGNKEGASTLLSDLIRSAPKAWGTRIKEIMERFDCY